MPVSCRQFLRARSIVRDVIAIAFDRSRVEISREKIAGAALGMFLFAALPIALASTGKAFEDGDVSWHIAAGRWILQHRAIPSVDPFSFTMAGRPWIAMEWLADCIYASAFAVADYAGVAAVVASAIIALHAILFMHLRRRAGLLGIVAAVAAMDAVLGPFLIARPHLLVWPILAAWTSLLLRSLDTTKPPPWWSTILLLLWTNLHGSFPLAILIAGAIALDALIEAKWRTLPQWSAFLALSLAALCLNANGIEGLLQPLHVTSLNMLSAINEWKPSTPSITPQFYSVMLLGLGILLWKGVRIPIGQLLLVLVLLALAFNQVRQQEWFIIVAALILPPLFEGQAPSGLRITPYLLLGAIGVVIRAMVPLVPPDSPANPRHLIAAIPADLKSKPVLNGYTFGGPLILSGIRPYIDGRADMYGDAFFSDYLEIMAGNTDAFHRAVSRYGIAWVIVPWGDKPLIQELDSSQDWRRLYADKVGVIEVRK